MIKSVRKLWRIMVIQTVLARYGVDQILVSIPFLKPLHFLTYLNPFNWFRGSRPRGESLRLALQALGPIFVKFGQALSTRRDLLPEDIANELALLQDKVPPFDGRLARRIVEHELGCPIEQKFQHLEQTPLASASVAQVHAAVLPDGEEVVVKILRPGISKKIHRDVSLMYTIARLVEKYYPDSARFRPTDVVREFEITITDELDLLREASNAATLRRNFKDSKQLYVPDIYWPYCTANIMVAERIHGIPISDIAQLKRHGVNLKKLAETGVEIFFTQVFRDSFFHADMHPGNIFVSSKNPENPRYICVDFGIMGSLDNQDKMYLAENFHAFFVRDYQRVAKLHIASGWVPSDTRSIEFESAVRAVCEPIFGRPLQDISVAQMLMRLFQIGRRFNMEIQPQLILLQKTLFAIEGLGRQLYPQLDLWTTAKPYLEQWLKEQASLTKGLKAVSQEYPKWLREAPRLPSLLYDILDRTHQYQIGNHRMLSKVNTAVANPSRSKTSFLRGVATSFVIVGFASFHFANIPVEWLPWGFIGGGVFIALLAWLKS